MDMGVGVCLPGCGMDMGVGVCLPGCGPIGSKFKPKHPPHKKHVCLCRGNISASSEDFASNHTHINTHTTHDVNKKENS